MNVKTILLPRFSLMKFPGRNSQALSRPEKDKARYTHFETQRNNAFQDSLYEFQREFSEEENTQAAGEQARGKEFDEMVAEDNDRFERNQKRRERLFLEADTQQEEVFQDNEAGREKLFLDGQRSRATAFENQQNALAKGSEWHTSARETLLSQGRQERKDACAAIDAALLDQFNKLMASQENCFVIEERRRDDVVEKLFDSKRMPKPSSSMPNDGVDISPSIQLPVVIERTEWRPSEPPLTVSAEVESDRPSIRGRRSRSRSLHTPARPPTIVSLRSLPTPAPPTIVPFEVPVRSRKYSSRSSSYSRSRSPSIYRNAPPVVDMPLRSASRSGSRRASRSPSVVSVPPPKAPPVVEMPPSWVSRPWSRSRSWSPPTAVDPLSAASDDSNMGDPLHKRFTNAQQERLQAFLGDERQRESRFQAAEDRREGAEHERTISFEHLEGKRSSKDRALQNAQEEHFCSAEAVRTEGNIRREEVFSAAEERRSQAFDMSLLLIGKQAEAEDSLENGFMKHLMTVTESLSKRQVAKLVAAKDDQWVRFREAQRRRDAQLASACPRIPIPSPEQSSIPIDRPSAPMPQVIIQRPVASEYHTYYYPTRPVTPEALASRDSRIVDDSRVRPFSPPTGFAPTALFRGPNVQDSLPVPHTTNIVHHELQQDIAAQDLQRGHQYIFERCQAWREEAFQRGIRRRRHIFSTNEARRQAEYEAQQRVRKAVYEEKETARGDDFKMAQQRRETLFRAAERGRAIEFHRKEKERDKTFGSSQQQRAEKFYRKQQELQTKCFEAEKRRFSELETWSTRLLQERESEQMEEYTREEAWREDEFEKLLEAYGSKRGSDY